MYLINHNYPENEYSFIEESCSVSTLLILIILLFTGGHGYWLVWLKIVKTLPINVPMLTSSTPPPKLNTSYLGSQAGQLYLSHAHLVPKHGKLQP